MPINNPPDDDVIFTALDGDILAYCCVDGENVGFMNTATCVGMGGTPVAIPENCGTAPEESGCLLCTSTPESIGFVYYYWTGSSFLTISDVAIYDPSNSNSSICRWALPEENPLVGSPGFVTLFSPSSGNYRFSVEWGSGIAGSSDILAGCPSVGVINITAEEYLQPSYGYLFLSYVPPPPEPETYDEVMSGGVLVGGLSSVAKIAPTIVSTGGVVAAGESTVTLQTSLLAHYPLYDNRSDTTVIDVSGNGLNGTIAGGDNSSALSVVGASPAIPMALDFDGTNDRISASGVAAPGTGSYTVLCRFKSDATTGYANGTTLFSMGMGSTATNGFRAVIINNLLYVECNDGTAAAGRRWSFTDTSNWHSLAMVIDRSTNKIIGYLDGSTSGSIAQNNANNGSDNVTGNINTGDSFRIGNRVNGATNLPFDGKLADVRVFNRALSAAQVLAYHNQQVMTGAVAGGVASVSMIRNPAASGGAVAGGSQIGLIPASIRNKATRVWEGSTYVDRKVGNTLTPVNSATITTGKIESAFSFPGSTNSYLQVARDNAAWYPTTGTLSYWWYIDFESNSGWAAANNVTSIVYDGNGLIVIRRDGGASARLQLRNQNSGGSTSHLTPNGSFPAVTGWHHVVMQWTTGGSVFFWLNNVKYTASTTFPGFDTSIGFPTIRISTVSVNADHRIEQLMLFDSALSDSEVSDIYYYGAGAYYSESFTQLVGGGAGVGGDSIVSVMTNVATSGGVVTGGESTVVRDIPEQVASGGIVASGDVIVTKEIPEQIASGGLLAAGDSIVSRDIPEQVASGGAVAGGQSYVYKNVDVVCGGSSLASLITIVGTSGGVACDGTVTIETSINIGGGSVVGGSALIDVLINYHYSLPLTIPAGRVQRDLHKLLVPIRVPGVVNQCVVYDSFSNQLPYELRRVESDYSVLMIKTPVAAATDTEIEVQYR